MSFDWYTAIIMMHIFGTILGAGAVTFSELYYLRSGESSADPSTAPFFKILTFMTDAGLIILTISGFAYLVYFRFGHMVDVMYQSRLWAKYTVLVVLFIATIAWKSRKIPIAVWAPVSFVSWYAAAVLGAWVNLSTPYDVIMAVYVLSVVIVGLGFQKIRQTQ